MNKYKFKLDHIIVLILLILIIKEFSFLSLLSSADVLTSIITISYFVFAILGMAGVFYQKHWGYYSVYIFAFISTVLVGINPIPSITELFPTESATIVVILSGLALCLFTLYLQLRTTNVVNKNLQ